MAIVILILAILLMFMLAKRGRDVKAREAFNKLPTSDKKKVTARRLRKQQEIDELITVILPTIRNDK
jgi:hypothetical protein